MPTIQRDGETFTVDERLPVLPLRDLVVFPYVVMPLLVGRPASLAAVEAATDGRHLLLVAQRSAETEEPIAADLHRVGVVARVLQLSRLANGGVKVLIEGIARVRITRFVPVADHLRAHIAAADGDFGIEPIEAVEPAARQALAQFEEYVALHRRLPPEVVTVVQAAETPARQAYGIAAHLSARLDVRQRLLEATPLTELLRQLVEVLTAETELLRLERKIEDEVRGTLFQNQREFYLQEQLKAIHRELGNEEGDDAEELERRIAEKGLPEPVKARALRELRKLKRTSPLSPESTVLRTYLDWILTLPWTERSEETLDLAHARRVLDEDHFGLDEVKDRILDYIAVLALVGRADGPILCLVGPPGVGKTSLGRSIARALGRRFTRMSLGGVRDEAEIRGHRRTYIGALPGRVIQAMRRAEVVNPVILLDEIDKLGQDYRGDPSSALLEVLDPEQNRAFNDHYLEVDYDLSQALFVTTANYLPQIPEPLRDRMEIIRLSGYLENEKRAIAEQFLIPKQLRASGIDPATVTWEPDALPAIIRGYTREAGVRELERRIARVARKLARNAVEARGASASTAGETSSGAASVGARGPATEERSAMANRGPDTEARGPGAGKRELGIDDRGPGVDPAETATEGATSGEAATDRGAAGADARSSNADSRLTVRTADLKSLLGTAPYDPSSLGLEDKVGVATGLAYTSTGGEVLEIEVSAVTGRGKVQLTGTLGDVMKESASAAISYARARAAALGIEREFYKTRDLHVHIPAGATPKDGPSAGIAIATAIISALTDVPVRGDVAMTGEITLRGRVLPIGGLKEKAVAAHRNHVAHVLVPHENARDLDDVPAEVRDEVSFHLVRTMDDVLALALVERAESAAPSAKGAATPSGSGGAGARRVPTPRPGPGAPPLSH